MWKELLGEPGGKLELSKCFKFDEYRNAIPTTINEQREICPQIMIPGNSNDKPITIKQKHPSESHRTLGTDKTMIHDEKQQVKELKIKSDKSSTG
jgi:hypothetical protein